MRSMTRDGTSPDRAADCAGHRVDRGLRTGICALILLLVTAGAALADRRVAFVVGNGAYRHVAPLPNPPLDARAMRDTLKRLGFEVVYGEDLDRKQMGQAIGQFAERAR